VYGVASESTAVLMYAGMRTSNLTGHSMSFGSKLPHKVFSTLPSVFFLTVVASFAYSHVLKCTILVLFVENLFFVFYSVLVWHFMHKIRCIIFVISVSSKEKRFVVWIMSG
jgi:hypothetical protein